MLQYTIVITGEHDDGVHIDINCQELMESLTRLINDHTIHHAECFVHDTSLPSSTGNK